jgi:ATP-binding cassette subfamily B protein
LFDGTIRENITFGNRQVADQQLAVAVSAAAMDEMVRHFPNGLDTVVGERGVILSGGQKQRITLARCFLQDTPILLLDDPVSQVDLETGKAIIDTIRGAAGQKTVIIVSHRLSAVSHADRIIALDQGRITESGTHAALMQTEGYYAKTFRLQQMEEEFNAS